MADDLLDQVLNLEETSYQDGYEEGKIKGAQEGQEEGRIFGLEQGFRKALAMGKLHGRAMMLNACLVKATTSTSSAQGNETASTSAVAGSVPSDSSFAEEAPFSLPTVTDNGRLQRHVDTLLRLTDPATIDPTNSVEAVDAFDERMKKAMAKAKVIDKLITEPYRLSLFSEEDSTDAQAQQSSDAARGGSGNIEELGSAAVRR